MKDNKLSDKVIIALNIVSDWLNEGGDKPLDDLICLGTYDDAVILAKELEKLKYDGKISSYFLLYKNERTDDGSALLRLCVANY